MKKNLVVLLLSTLTMCQAAHASQVVLYEKANYQGNATSLDLNTNFDIDGTWGQAKYKRTLGQVNNQVNSFRFNWVGDAPACLLLAQDEDFKGEWSLHFASKSESGDVVDYSANASSAAYTELQNLTLNFTVESYSGFYTPKDACNVNTIPKLTADSYGHGREYPLVRRAHNGDLGSFDNTASTLVLPAFKVELKTKGDVEVPLTAGYKVTLYKHNDLSGPYTTFMTSDTAQMINLSDYNFSDSTPINDAVSAFKVEYYFEPSTSSQE